MQLGLGHRVTLLCKAVGTVPYLKKAALLEDIADELIQVHQTLVVPDMMSENRQHHGVLWTTERIVQKGNGKDNKRRKDR